MGAIIRMAFLNPRAPTIEDMSRLSVCRQVDFYDAVSVRDHERMHMQGAGGGQCVCA
jgi:hypothetical protein